MRRAILRPFVFLVLAALLIPYASGCTKGSSAPAEAPEPALVSISVSPASPVVEPGTSVQFAATGTYSDNSEKDLTSFATWTSSTAAVATVSDMGTATPLAAGSAIITASSGTASGSATLTVTTSGATPTLQNSADADGFLWGTEGQQLAVLSADNLPSSTAMVRDDINTLLKTKYVKVRFQSNSFSSSDGGVTYSPSGCLPTPSNCVSPFNTDEVAKLFKANGWSMLPMLSYDPSDMSPTSAKIDAFVNFVDWFVDRYRSDAGIRYLELQNAPVGGPNGWWHGTTAQLLELSNKVYDRIKTKYPDVQVGTPGFEYWSDTAGDAVMNQAVDEVNCYLDTANGAKFDFWAFHGYPLSDVSSTTGASVAYAPTLEPAANKYAGVPGILEVRKALDANGWQARPIIDTEHVACAFQATDPTDRLEAALLLQQSVLERTLHTTAGSNALAGVVELKVGPHGTQGEALWGSLYSNGGMSKNVGAVGLLWDKLHSYNYAGRLSGSFDTVRVDGNTSAENVAWVEKFASGNRELYIFFKPFGYQSGQPASFDGSTVDYLLNLSKMPSSAVLTDLTGAASTVAPAQTLTLAAENSPKFLEVTYP